MVLNNFWLRVMGLLGIMGGLLLLAGDMLFYYSQDSTNLLLNMGNSSDTRILLSGITALFATFFYLLGTAQVYFAFKTNSAFIRNSVVLSFAWIFISYGIIHGAYVAIAATAKLAIQNNMDIETATALASKVNHILRLFVYPAFAYLSILFIIQVWRKKTLYPRWIIFFFPLIPFLFNGIISKSLSGVSWIVIAGGYFNLILIIFFLASTIALWNSGNDIEIKKVRSEGNIQKDE